MFLLLLLLCFQGYAAWEIFNEEEVMQLSHYFSESFAKEPVILQKVFKRHFRRHCQHALWLAGMHDDQEVYMGYVRDVDNSEVFLIEAKHRCGRVEFRPFARDDNKEHRDDIKKILKKLKAKKDLPFIVISLILLSEEAETYSYSHNTAIREKRDRVMTLKNCASVCSCYLRMMKITLGMHAKSHIVRPARAIKDVAGLSYPSWATPKVFDCVDLVNLDSFDEMPLHIKDQLMHYFVDKHPLQDIKDILKERLATIIKKGFCRADMQDEDEVCMEYMQEKNNDGVVERYFLIDSKSSFSQIQIHPNWNKISPNIITILEELEKNTTVFGKSLSMVVLAEHACVYPYPPTTAVACGTQNLFFEQLPCFKVIDVATIFNMLDDPKIKKDDFTSKGFCAII